MSVDYVRPEVSDLRPVYKMVRDVLGGPHVIQGNAKLYLPHPDPEGVNPDSRYRDYVTRAIFFSATARTHEGYLGQMFYRETQIELPALLEVLRNDADGEGTTLEQQAKKVAGEVLALGRGGLYVDYTSQVEGEASIQDQEEGKVRPVIYFRDTESIINWRYTTIGTTRILSLVVLEEVFCEEDDGFEEQAGVQYRELRIEFVEGRPQFVCRIWRKSDSGSWYIFDEAIPLTGSGEAWTYIPFFPIGSSENNIEPDTIPMESMAHVNIGHYRNSADYEESVFIVGQPTPWASGITKDWYEDVWDNELILGSRGFIPLPPNSSVGLLQANPNIMAKEAMEIKREWLVSLGAKLAESKQVQTTATQENRESVIENSTLSSVAKNVSSAYQAALRACALFAGEDPDVPLLELNTDFEITRLSPQDRQQLLSEWQGGAITWEEFRWNMKRSGIAYEDDAEAYLKIQQELGDGLNLDDEDG